MPNLTRELNACEVWRLNQLNSTVLNATFAVSATETVEDSTQVRFKRRISHVPNLMREL